MTSNQSSGQWSRMARQQAAVARIGQLALFGVALDELVDAALGSVAEQLELDVVALLDIDERGETHRVHASIDRGAPPHVGPSSSPIAVRSLESISAYTIAQGGPISSGDLQTETRFTVADPAGRAAIASPVGIGDRPWGVICGFAEQPRDWPGDDLHFLNLMANTIGLAIYRNRAEERTEALLAAEQAARLAGDRARDRLSTIIDGSARFNASLEPRHVLEGLAEFLVPRLADVCVVDIIDGAGELGEGIARAIDDGTLDAVRELRRRRRSGGRGRDDTRTVARTGRPILMADIDPEVVDARAIDDQHRAAFGRLGVNSAILVPLSARGRVIGVMSLLTTSSGRSYDTEDLVLARELADRAALALDNGRLFESHSRIARSLQSALLPPALPAIDGIEMAARYQVAGDHLDVGGDFYDVIEMGDSVWGLVIGDVSGRGLDAAALTGLVRHSVRAAVVRERLPSGVLSQTNQAVMGQITDGRFCTAAFIRLEERPGRGHRLVASSAGHPLPLVLRRDGTVEELACTGQLIGVVDEPKLIDVQAELGPGDAVVLFTDGLTEARRDGKEFGEGDLETSLRALAGRDATAIVDGLVDAVEGFSSEVGDDRAILVVRVAGDTGPAPDRRNDHGSTERNG